MMSEDIQLESADTKSKSISSARFSRQPSPPLTDDEAREIVSSINDLTSARCLIATDRLMVGKLTDKLRRMNLIFSAIIAVIGGLSGLAGVVLTPTDATLPKSVKIALYITAGLAASGVTILPKVVDWIKQFSGRSYKEEFPIWERLGYNLETDPSFKTLADAQMGALSMFAFVRPENDLRDSEPARQQIHALTHFLTVMQSTSSTQKYLEAYKIVMPVFRIASTGVFVTNQRG